MVTCGFHCVNELLKKLFNNLGIFIAKNPGYFIIVPVLLSVLCMTGFQQINYEIDPEYLFSPIDGRGKAERAIVEEFFEMNYTNQFNVERITRPGHFGRVIVLPEEEEDKTILRKEIFIELRQLNDIILNFSVIVDDESFTYRDICAKWQGSCIANDILNLDYLIDDIVAGQLNLTFPIMFNPITWDGHILPMYFGGIERNEDDIVTAVSAIQLIYFTTLGNKKFDKRGAMWEEAFLDIVGKLENSRTFKHISISYFTSKTLDIEMERNTKAIVPYYGSTFLMMALFSIIACMMGDSVRSKPWLGLMGNISAVMGTLAAFGFGMYLGIEFIGINLAAPFLMIGIGIDDTFVMIAAWRQTKPKLSVAERMAQTMSDAAVSITITSLTDIISFVIGIISPFRSVQIFCAYSALAIGFTYLWHITFFAACMAISGYREKKNLHALIGCQVDALSTVIREKRNCLYRAFMAGGINKLDPDNSADNKEHMLMAFFKTYIAAVINNKWCKIIIILIFGGYLAGACYGIRKIEEGLDRRRLAPSDSYAVEFFNREDDYYREFPYRIQVLLTGELNYSDATVQSQIENLTRTFEKTSYVTTSLYTESWLRSYLSFIEYNSELLNLTITDEKTFIAGLKEHWLTPDNPFKLDIKFNENQTQIIASRFLIQLINITDTNHEKEMLKDLRNICNIFPSLNASIFHPYFIFFDQYELIRPTALQEMFIGAIIMMIISFIFIPNILCSLWVAISVISIELGVAGYMALWDVNLDSISMINLIMCIGFSVDFTAHICYTYMSSKKKYPSARVRESLYSLGLPILQGSSATILGVLALLLAETYIFTVFFKIVFLVMLFGALHGLFLLPVLLSLFGPGSMQTWKGMDNGMEEEIMDDNNITFHPSHSYSSTTAKRRFGSIYNVYGNEKDLGIGTTSGEDSTDSINSIISPSTLQRSIQEEILHNRYEDTWRELRKKGSLSQFQPSVPDFYQPQPNSILSRNLNKLRNQRHLSLGDLIYLEQHSLFTNELPSSKWRPNQILPQASSTAKRYKKRINMQQAFIPRVVVPWPNPRYIRPVRSATNLNFFHHMPPVGASPYSPNAYA